jgi:hypothetical protein
MSGDEVMVMVLSFVTAILGWRWLAMPPRARRPGVPAWGWLWLVPLLGAAGVWVVLKTLASFDVREAPEYLTLYTLLGLAWMSFGGGPWLGVSARDDVGERGNVAAFWLYAGAVLGCAACYAGANVGDGPGWWCVVWAGMLATAGWAGTFHLLHGVTGIVEHVTVDRDVASGVRAASFLLVSGVLWGRGGAGDWTSAFHTVLELRAAWPVALLFVKAVWVERLVKPRPDRPHGALFRHGVLPALVDLALLGPALLAAGPLPDSYRPGAP